MAILRERCPDLKIRFVNVVNRIQLMPDNEHPHGLTDKEFGALFTVSKPVIFNFHAYPSLIHKLTYRRGTTRTSMCGDIRRRGISNAAGARDSEPGDRFNLASTY